MTTKTTMAAIAALVTVLGMSTAYAADQQITNAEQDYQVSVEMARGAGPYAQASGPDTRVQPSVSTLNGDFQAQGSH